MNRPQHLRRLFEIGRIGLVGALAAYGFMYARNPGSGGPLASVNLAIHETGHLLFGPLGELMGFLGGTLFQLIVPLTFVGYFLRRRERFSAAVPLWWTGHNLMGISVYVRDARTQLLPLVGGGVHDWGYLLGRWGWLPYDQAIANGVHFGGVLVVVGSLLATIRYLGEDPTDGPVPSPEVG